MLLGGEQQVLRREPHGSGVQQSGADVREDDAITVQQRVHGEGGDERCPKSEGRVGPSQDGDGEQWEQDGLLMHLDGIADGTRRLRSNGKTWPMSWGVRHDSRHGLGGGKRQEHERTP